MLSLQGFTPIWGFSMRMYKTFEKDFSRIGANLPPRTLKNCSNQALKSQLLSVNFEGSPLVFLALGLNGF